MFECKICDKQFTAKTSMRRHLKCCQGRDKSKKYKCDECDSIFSRKHHAQRHKLAKHSLVAFFCELCKKSFTLKDTLVKHLRDFHGPNKETFTCHECDSIFFRESKLNSHIILMHSPAACESLIEKRPLLQHDKAIQNGEKTNNTGNLSDDSFLDKEKLDVHNKVEHPPFTCGLCEKSFTVRYNFVKHVRCFHGADYKKYKCDECDSLFSKKDLLYSHKLIQHSTDATKKIPLVVKEIEYICKLCDKVFLNKDNFKNHQKVKHKPYACELCKKSFTLRISMLRHLIGFHGRKKETFKCDECDSIFSKKSTLNWHIVLKHFQAACESLTEKRPLVQHDKAIQNVEKTDNMCDLCDKIFSDKEKLNVHKKVEHPPFTCGLCEKSFSYEGTFVRHVKKLHIADYKKYKCDECDLLFSREDLLNSHKLEQHSTDVTKNIPLVEKEIEYICNLCDKVFLNKIIFKNHQKVEHKPYACELCEKSFISRGTMAKHLKNIHGQKKETFKCDECDSIFSKKSKLNWHIVLKHFQAACESLTEKRPLVQHDKAIQNVEKTDNMCDLCDRIFSDKEKLNVHKKVEHPPFTCGLCEKSFSYEGTFVRHVKKLHIADYKKYKCDECDLLFSREDLLNSHKLEQHSTDVTKNIPLVENEIEYICNLCDKVFLNKIIFKNHQKVEHKPYACELCEKSFNSKRTMANHLKNIHGQKKETFKCDECDSIFEKKSTLNTHIVLKHFPAACESFTENRTLVQHDKAIQNGEKTDNMCDLCDRIFLDKEKLNVHKKVEHPPFTCGLCEKSFSYQSTFVRHVKKLHIADYKKYKCDECDLLFSKEDLLNSHKLLQHSTDATKKIPMVEKKIEYICNLCDKVFFNKDNFKNHQKLKHKPFPCELCKKSFSRKRGMVKHLTNFHGRKRETFKCDECDSVFFKKSTLNAHIIIMHFPAAGQSFTEKNPLIRPEKAIQNGEKTDNTCDLCDKSFLDKETLNVHKRVEHLPFICRICETSFSTRHNLVKHVTKFHAESLISRKKLDEKEIEYNCNLCERVFFNKDNFKNHQKVKHKHKPFTCELCKKSFSSKRSMIKHLTNFHGRKRDTFKCDECDSIFFKKSKLYSHIILMHSLAACESFTEQRPLVRDDKAIQNGEKTDNTSDLCDKSFLDKEKLNVHKRVDHPPFNCKICDTSFTLRCTFVRHVKKFHAESLFSRKNLLNRHEANVATENSKEENFEPIPAQNNESTNIQKVQQSSSLLDGSMQECTNTGSNTGPFQCFRGESTAQNNSENTSSSSTRSDYGRPSNERNNPEDSEMQEDDYMDWLMDTLISDKDLSNKNTKPSSNPEDQEDNNMDCLINPVLSNENLPNKKTKPSSDPEDEEDNDIDCVMNLIQNNKNLESEITKSSSRPEEKEDNHIDCLTNPILRAENLKKTKPPSHPQDQENSAINSVINLIQKDEVPASKITKPSIEPEMQEDNKIDCLMTELLSDEGLPNKITKQLSDPETQENNHIDCLINLTQSDEGLSSIIKKESSNPETQEDNAIDCLMNLIQCEEGLPSKTTKLSNDPTFQQDKAIDCMTKVLKVAAKRDKYSVFGEFIADKTRNSRKSLSEITIARKHIESVLQNLIIGFYDQGTS